MDGLIQSAGSVAACEINPAAPELDLLRTVLRNRRLADRLARAPGGWRDLSGYELDQLRLTADQKRAVEALQELVRRSYPELPKHQFVSATMVAQVYAPRLSDLRHEVMLAVALNGQNRFLAELEMARGGRHATALTVGDVLRPLLRVGASAFILVHNHPSGDPLPSREDKAMTDVLQQAARIVGLTLVDHVVIGGRGGGATSLAALGLIEKTGEEDRTRSLSIHAASDNRLR